MNIILFWIFWFYPLRELYPLMNLRLVKIVFLSRKNILWLFRCDLSRRDNVAGLHAVRANSTSRSDLCVHRRCYPQICTPLRLDRPLFPRWLEDSVECIRFYAWRMCVRGTVRTHIRMRYLGDPRYVREREREREHRGTGELV